ncbi:putative sphingomyelinase [Tieghemostelium lacteum]|uniref:Putative sphingomyelinase n=1 Tax=Tieghemostelium lacteum TaxID=361077 RepID=A0A151ZBB1_TIELA|nr:putative sphingomyelinase [Tieghemostelium lacteum]|eukprot:KYQ91228.1 putative sphingomyelinase [Tieghemostelium lacteum]
MMRYSLLVLIVLIFGLTNAFNYQFFHLSDVHYSSAVNSQTYNQSTMCIPPALYEEMKKMEVDDHHDIIKSTKSSIFNNTASGLYGRYGCDTNSQLLQSTIQQMKIINPTPDFIIYTGDSVGHSLPQGLWQESQTTFVKTVQSEFSQQDTIFIPSIGNNDVFPDYNSQCSDQNLQYLTTLWSEWIPSDQVQNFSISGSLVFNPVPGLTVISLNTVLYSVKNTNSFQNAQDPCGQFAWLEYQLQVARQNNQYVYIIGHIFPGLDPFYLQTTWKVPFITSFFNILSNYEDVLKSGFFGHIHRDEFRSVFISNFTTGYFPMFIGSSITPVYINNPSVKIFSYEASTANVTDFTAYYADIYISNLLGSMTWKYEYSFVNDYLSTSIGIDGTVLNDFVDVMQANDNIYDAYDDHRTSNYLSDNTVNLCLAQSLTVDSFNDCLNYYATIS